MKLKILSTLILVSISQLIFCQNIFENTKIGFGLDFSYRNSYANNNWLPGLASDIRINLSKEIDAWQPEVYFRKNIFNFTDKIEYPDAKTWEVGSILGRKVGLRHEFFLGGGLNRVSYQKYNYNIIDGWSEATKRGKKNRFVYQIGYQFNFIVNKRIDLGVSLAYHNVRKIQMGLDINYNLKKK